MAQAGDSVSRPYKAFDHFGCIFLVAVIIINFLELLLYLPGELTCDNCTNAKSAFKNHR